MSTMKGISGKTIWIETDHKVLTFLDYLPAGKRREKAIIRFIAQHGGTRTILVEDLTLLR